MTLVQNIIRWLRSRVQPDLDTIFSTFTKAQAKLERLIDKELSALHQETASINQLRASRIERNRVIDRAYRVSHNLDQLTA